MTDPSFSPRPPAASEPAVRASGSAAAPPATPPVGRAPGRRRLLPIVVAAALIAGLAAAAAVLARPTLTVSNGLLAPVHLVVNDSAQVVPPGATVRVKVGRGLLVAQWELERPLSADRQPMGEVVRGSWVVLAPRGTVSRAAGPRTDAGDYFAPLVTNETTGLLRNTVNAGLDGARDCGCAVRPGARRVFLGYYRLYRNTTVRATDAEGRTATFRDLGPEAQARGWSVGLRFAEGDFGNGKP